MQKARRHPVGLRPLVSTRFQVLFTPLVGVLFIVHSRYWFTIGRRGVLRLGGWSPHVQTGFHEPGPTLGLTGNIATGLSPCIVRLSRQFAMHSGLSAFARRYLRSRCCFPFLRLLRCFSSPRSLPYPMHSDTDDPCGPGFPIRKSQDQSSVTSSPGHIAGSNVLHRLSTPRHPPCALNNLTAPTSTRSRRNEAKIDLSSSPRVVKSETAVSSKQDSPQVTWLLKISRSRCSQVDLHLGERSVNIATSCTGFQRAVSRPKDSAGCTRMTISVG